MPVSFIKMHGIGNDFVIIDARYQTVELTADGIRGIAARRTGVGCDQVIVLEESRKADCFMRIYNADGGQVDACGNATRCVAWLMMHASGLNAASIETAVGILMCHQTEGDRVCVNMGAPIWEWEKIPLAQAMDTLHTGIKVDENLSDPVAVSMGNPHAVFFVDSMQKLETANFLLAQQTLKPHFPEGVNISVALLDTKEGIANVRVLERGVGETFACGTAACAVMAASRTREHAGDILTVRFIMTGGTLDMQWEGGEILMTGEVAA
ncbi:MAG: diaminopimelate epimerase, partial [Alphaproteobacteria bacterium]